ncbi:hypothetical protein [Emticicia sp. 17c]|uniref:hypothetical protein n=1 Tax=Emticicia sp. 17c TaxID=3127704 RepID=UPI00301CACAD
MEILKTILYSIGILVCSALIWAIVYHGTKVILYILMVGLLLGIGYLAYEAQKKGIWYEQIIWASALWCAVSIPLTIIGEGIKMYDRTTQHEDRIRNLENMLLTYKREIDELKKLTTTNHT